MEPLEFLLPAEARFEHNLCPFEITVGGGPAAGQRPRGLGDREERIPAEVVDDQAAVVG